jgi:uncharacterized protein (TIGR01777 family)
MKIFIAGATGFIGRRLVRRILDEGRDSVLAFTRDAGRARLRLPPEVETVAWEPLLGPPPTGVLEGAGAVINLAGEPIAQRWSPVAKERIRGSRLTATRNLVTGILAAGSRPGVLVSASATGYYGPREDEPLDETASPGTGFLADLCRDWEAEAMRAAEVGVRRVTPRIGIVLGPHGGVLSRMVPFFKTFLGGPLGDGRQWMSWIHIDDLVGLILHAVRGESVSGPVNAVAPAPVTNLDFARGVGRVLGRPSAVPTPASVLRLLLGQEFADVLLTGQRVLPKKAQETGYRFRYPELEPALRDALSR